MAIQDVIKRLIYQFTSTGADKVADDIGKVNTEQTKLAASTPQVTKASLDLSKSFENLERRFDSTIRAQQDYQKVQDKVNAAVAQNPALQERANSVLALAAQHYDRAGKATSAYAGAVDAARGAALGLAAGIGPLGAVLGSFGPWGIAAAAGIGLVANAFTALSEGAKRAGDAALSLKSFAENTGLTVAQVRGLSEAGDDFGIAEEKIVTGLQKFTVNLDAARKGTGNLYEGLQEIDRRLADQVANANNSAEALNALAKAYAGTTDATTKAALAVAAFGKSGVEIGRILQTIADAGGIDKQAAAAEKALGVTAEWTEAVAKLRIEQKDLTADLERMKETFYAKEMLERAVEALRIEKEMLRTAQQLFEMKAKGVPLFGDTEAAGGALYIRTVDSAAKVTDELTEAKKKANEASKESVAATAADTQATQANTAAKNANLQASQSAKDVAALGSAATPQERGQARIDALMAGAASLSPGVLERAIQGVRDETEKAAKGMEKYSSAADGAKNTLGDLMRTNQGISDETKDIASSTSNAAREAERLKEEAARVAQETEQAAQQARQLAQAWESAALAGAEARRSAGTSYRYGVPGGTQEEQGRAYRYGSEDMNVAASTLPLSTMTFLQQHPDWKWESSGPSDIGRLVGPEQAEEDIADTLFRSGLGPDPALKNSIDDLKDSTDRLNATNQELLSPYYTQDPRTSHIGFRSQGMASGGYVDVPGGYSANDNMMAMIPVASGERIYVDPMTGKRGGGSGGPVTINISSPITVNGNINKDEFGRTLYQSNQQLSKQVRAATQ